MGIYGQTVDIRSPFFRVLKDDTQILIQAILMRLDTARGTLWTDTDYGLAVAEQIGDGMTEESFARLAERIRAEVEKDERLEKVALGPGTSTSNAKGRVSVTVDLRITPRLTGPFSLVLAISDVSVEILTRGN